MTRRRGAKAMTWDWSFIQGASTDVMCYQLTQQQIVFLMTIFQQANWSTRWFNRPQDFEEVENFVSNVQYALLNAVSCDSGEIEPAQVIYQQCGTGGLESEICEECENMARVWVEQQGTKWYLKSDCSGCQPVMFELTAVQVGSDGLPIAAENGGSPGIEWSELDPVSDANCYAALAVPYMLGRANSFFDQVIDFVFLGGDVFANDWDEYLNIALVIADLILNVPDLEDIQAFTKQQVSDAVNDASVVDALTTAWTFTGEVDKDELKTWVSNAPAIANNVPIKLFLQTWIDYSWMFGYNSKLAQYAASCNSGNPIPGEYPLRDLQFVADGFGTPGGDISDMQISINNSYASLSYVSTGDAFPEAPTDPTVQVVATRDISACSFRLIKRSFYRDWTEVCSEDYATNQPLMWLDHTVGSVAALVTDTGVTPGGDIYMDIQFSGLSGLIPTALRWDNSRACRNTGITTVEFNVEITDVI